jgi:5-methylcytosine-specific restriction endonuclease McrA
MASAITEPDVPWERSSESNRTLAPSDRRADVSNRGGGRCHNCGVTLHPFRDFEIDRLHPHVLDGLDDPTNLVAACRCCNRAKGAQNATSFRAQLAGPLS